MSSHLSQFLHLWQYEQEEPPHLAHRLDRCVSSLASQLLDRLYLRTTGPHLECYSSPDIEQLPNGLLNSSVRAESSRSTGELMRSSNLPWLWHPLFVRALTVNVPKDLEGHVHLHLPLSQSKIIICRLYNISPDSKGYCKSRKQTSNAQSESSTVGMLKNWVQYSCTATILNSIFWDLELHFTVQSSCHIQLHFSKWIAICVQ